MQMSYTHHAPTARPPHAQHTHTTAPTTRPPHTHHTPTTHSPHTRHAPTTTRHAPHTRRRDESDEESSSSSDGGSDNGAGGGHRHRQGKGQASLPSVQLFSPILSLPPRPKADKGRKAGAAENGLAVGANVGALGAADLDDDGSYKGGDLVIFRPSTLEYTVYGPECIAPLSTCFQACTVCYDLKPLDEFAVFCFAEFRTMAEADQNVRAKPRHPYSLCRDCFVQHAHMSLDEGKKLYVRCPAPDCRRSLQVGVWRGLLAMGCRRSFVWRHSAGTLKRFFPPSQLTLTVTLTLVFIPTPPPSPSHARSCMIRRSSSRRMSRPESTPNYWHGLGNRNFTRQTHDFTITI